MAVVRWCLSSVYFLWCWSVGRSPPPPGCFILNWLCQLLLTRDIRVLIGRHWPSVFWSGSRQNFLVAVVVTARSLFVNRHPLDHTALYLKPWCWIEHNRHVIWCLVHSSTTRCQEKKGEVFKEERIVSQNVFMFLFLNFKKIEKNQKLKKITTHSYLKVLNKMLK